MLLSFCLISWVRSMTHARLWDGKIISRAGAVSALHLVSKPWHGLGLNRSSGNVFWVELKLPYPHPTLSIIGKFQSNRPCCSFLLPEREVPQCNVLQDPCQDFDSPNFFHFYHQNCPSAHSLSLLPQSPLIFFSFKNWLNLHFGHPGRCFLQFGDVPNRWKGWMRSSWVLPIMLYE